MKKSFCYSITFCFVLTVLSGMSQCETFFGKLVINEVVAANNNVGSDELGEFDDWVEIYNGSEETINLEGYFLSDNHGNKTKFVFPDIDILPDDVVVIWCDNQPEQGPLHTTFGLSAGGEEVGLYNPDTVSLDYVRYGSLPDDIAIGRFPNGVGPFNILIPSFNDLNVNSILPGLVINEYQSDNISTAQDQWGGFEDWIEIYNNSNNPINLEGYFLSDKIGDPTQFIFPDTTILPNDYMIVWCDQGGLFEPGLHTFFKLGSGGDDILFSTPDTTTIDYVRFGIIPSDQTEGRLPNGVGKIDCLNPTHGESNGDPLSVFNEALPENLKVYPNPSSGLLQIDFPQEERTTLTVHSLTGQLVYQNSSLGNQETVDLSFLPKGIYLLRINNKVAKLVLE